MSPDIGAKQLTITLVCIFLKSFLVMFLGVKYTLACSSIINNTEHFN